MTPTLERRLQRLGIQPKDLEENFVLGSGPGGQKINKTASCVLLRHRPSGTEIRCQESRSRDQNRILARERLCDQLEAARLVKKQRAAKQRAAERYRKRGRSRAEKARLRQSKRFRSEKKQLRRRVDS
ncbi:MAG: peptide chain release factor-like protein [Verrucomicrobiota bacterium]